MEGYGFALDYSIDNYPLDEYYGQCVDNWLSPFKFEIRKKENGEFKERRRVGGMNYAKRVRIFKFPNQNIVLIILAESV